MLEVARNCVLLPTNNEGETMNRKYSTGFSQSLLFSREEAMRLRSNTITLDHLLLGLLRDRQNTATRLMGNIYHNLDDIKRAIESRQASGEAVPVTKPEDLSIAPSATSVLKNSVDEAFKMGSDTISTLHLLLAILREDNSAAVQELNARGIEYETIKRQAAPPQPVRSEQDFDDDEIEMNPFGERGPLRINAAPSKQRKPGETPFLDKFGTDLTQAAREGKLDPVVGREKEIERIAQILSRRKKNNPILIGEPGVGKTAIVEGLAQRIAEHKISAMLFDKRIVALNMAAIVAGTKYRGQFEERIQGLLDELKDNKDVILFIDEIHTIIGAGGAAGSMDAANMLKPALSRGALQCIGSTTTDEYRKTIEKDGALERRFQKVMVEATTADETLQILRNIKDKYEAHHNVEYTDEALQACVRLTDRYITERQFPDKAIDALDEAGSRVHINNVTVPDNIKNLEEQIAKLKAQKEEAVKNQQFEKAANLRDEEKMFQKTLTETRNEWEKTLKQNRLTVGRSEVEETVSIMSGVPVQRVIDDEGMRLRGLKSDLQSHVIAQDKAIDKLVKAITRNRIGLRDPNKPIGTFLFLGPTGVGKTYLAKELAQYMFGSPDALIRIDMSEYMEKYSTSRLVGAPPGYVGYEEGGQLTEKVRRHPYSIVLLDEIEKANKDVFNLLLQVMDEGRLTDSNGSTVDFKNTIIIITSNTGTRQVAEFGNGIGFQPEPTAEQMSKMNQDIIRKALNREFAPEFLNRLDDIIMFDQLTKESIGTIADLELKKLNERMLNLGYQFKLDKKARDFIIDKGYDKKFGARPLKRAIQTYVEDGLSDFLLSDDKPEGNLIRITHRKDQPALSFSA